MRIMHIALRVAMAAAVMGPVAACADHAGAIVIPTIPGVPVMVNGRDVSYAVIEGDWGLYRPGAVTPTVTYYNYHTRTYAPSAAPYFPKTGNRPGYGRYEVEPSRKRKLPPRAESFERSWNAGSTRGPVTIAPAYEPPAVILAPRGYDHDLGHDGR